MARLAERIWVGVLCCSNASNSEVKDLVEEKLDLRVAPAELSAYMRKFGTGRLNI